MAANPYESPIVAETLGVDGRPARVRQRLLIATVVLFAMSVFAFCLILVASESSILNITFTVAQDFFWVVFLTFLVVLIATMLAFIADVGARPE